MPQHDRNRIAPDRRAFLAAAAGLPAWYAAEARAADEKPQPADRPKVALIGCGGRGTGITKGAVRFGEVVAVCDVDADRAAAAAKAFPGAKSYSDFRKALEANPEGYIAQPTLSLSTCPTFVESGIAPRHIDLRPFVLSGKEVQMVPGGLTRVALKEGSLVVNSSQGGGTKDTWVLEA